MRKFFSFILTQADEFHHAVANNYKNIIDYFNPKFMLGLTATPDRLDNKDVYALCDYNVVYEVGLREGINKGWLCPFRYYGIYGSSTARIF
ncbi:DEAD/DEAH box helicase family protein [Oceanirhabdus seepicola]|uniref:DEAD/DEAH box helicase family protein n=1 Tax=Oceanirhabdus seepicola TaxID=2828781 RepID=A0A9J6NYZ1_9CLOT|nr:DEAD/DEAH box helicase family protein [Oceanirhabdus seepicola]